MMIEKEKSLHNKAKKYNQFDKIFSEIIKGFDKVLSYFDPTLFFPIKNNQFSLFGQDILFSWRFIFVDDLPCGEMIVNHLIDDTTNSLNPFFTRYFDPKGRIYSKPSQAPSEYYFNDYEQMEELFFMILDDFYKLDCFKA